MRNAKTNFELESNLLRVLGFIYCLFGLASFHYLRIKRNGRLFFDRTMDLCSFYDGVRSVFNFINGGARNDEWAKRNVSA